MQNRESITLVTGATGAQGGGVAHSLLAEGRKVRILTRNAGGAAASALRALGAEVAAGDLADVPALVRAMEGCDSVFGVTNFWEHFGCEIVHGKNIVDAARLSGVSHLVMSTLPSSLALSGGEITVAHLESKAEVEAYARQSGIPSTFVHVAFYFDNFLTFFPPRAGADGVLGFGFPQGETRLAGVAVEDVGPVVAAIFRDRARFLGQVVGIVGEELRGHEYAAVLTRALGREVRYTHIPREAYAAFGFPGAEELAAMFDLNRRFILSREADVILTRTLNPAAQSFERWAAANRDRFATVLAPAA
ncbi:MAG: hypothetical protein JWP87_3619 [Labilithrix sp.]|nr:hypothetical protein [Labilithrix sp.]